MLSVTLLCNGGNEWKFRTGDMNGWVKYFTSNMRNSSMPTTVKPGCMLLHLWTAHLECKWHFTGPSEAGSLAEDKRSPAAGISSHGAPCLMQCLLVAGGTKSGASPQRHCGPQEPQTFGASAGDRFMCSRAQEPSHPAVQDIK